MTLQATLNAALQQAVRQQDAATRTILRTVLGEAQNKSLRNSTEVNAAMLISIMKDSVTNNNTILAARNKPELVRENEILQAFLPQNMSDEALMAAITASNGTDIGQVMRHLSANFAGRYNGDHAKTLANQWLKRS